MRLLFTVIIIVMVIEYKNKIRPCMYILNAINRDL